MASRCYPSRPPPCRTGDQRPTTTRQCVFASLRRDIDAVKVTPETGPLPGVYVERLLLISSRGIEVVRRPGREDLVLMSVSDDCRHAILPSLIEPHHVALSGHCPCDARRQVQLRMRARTCRNGATDTSDL